MKRYHGNETAEPGVYFNPRQLAFRSLEQGERLPGTEIDEYRRVPWFVLLFAGPILGLAYVVFLPFIGVAMVVWLGVTKVADLISAAVRSATRALRPGWEPATAFLSRSRERETGSAESDEWAENMRRELDRDDHGEN